MRYHIALLPQHFKWGGGLDFLRHISNGLCAVSDKYQLQLFIAVEQEFIGMELYAQLKDFIQHTSSVSLTEIFYSNQLNDLAERLIENKIDIVLPVNADLGVNFPIPWVTYIPDFQHKYLHQNFTEHECFSRETAFAARLRDSKAVVVNSEAVRQDILTFYPWINPQRVFALPYSPHPMPEWLMLEPLPVQQKYQLGQRYFILCNQFWVHKDHPTAFRAFAMLSDPEVELVCTGVIEDYRRPDYAQELKQLLQELNIYDRVRLLGHVSKEEQISLLKGALALVQPTLFEGGPGGGAVYDAVSLGIPVVLSDIRVNKEVKAVELDFFETGSAESLARVLSNRLQRPTFPIPETLLSLGESNQQALGERLYQLIQFTLGCYQKA